MYDGDAFGWIWRSSVCGVVVLEGLVFYRVDRELNMMIVL